MQNNQPGRMIDHNRVLEIISRDFANAQVKIAMLTVGMEDMKEELDAARNIIATQEQTISDLQQPIEDEAVEETTARKRVSRVALSSE